MIEYELKSALNEEQFEVYFQPKIDLKSEKICSLECLVRWQHPKLGLLLPKSFISYVEKLGLIVQLERWVYTYSLNKFKCWRKQNIAKHLTMALNLSPLHLKRPDFLDFITTLIKKNNIPPNCIELEITETNLMYNIPDINYILLKISEFGIRIAIDDFGTGYSSLAYLKRLKIDTLKIDRSFISDVPAVKKDSTIVHFILEMARSLGLYVVAEGVETQEQLDFLNKENCQCAQGYLFSKPLAVTEIELILNSDS